MSFNMYAKIRLNIYFLQSAFGYGFVMTRIIFLVFFKFALGFWHGSNYYNEEEDWVHKRKQGTVRKYFL